MSSPSSSSVTTEIANSKIYNITSSVSNDNGDDTVSDNSSSSSNYFHRVVMLMGIFCMVIVGFLSSSFVMDGSNHHDNHNHNNNMVSSQQRSSSFRGLTDEISSRDTTTAETTPSFSNQSQQEEQEEEQESIQIKVVVHGGLRGNEESLAYALSHAIHRDIPHVEHQTMNLVLVNKRSEDGKLSKPITIHIPNGILGKEEEFLHELTLKEELELDPFPFVFEDSMTRR